MTDEPKLAISISGPNLSSLALLVELADHIGIDDDAKVELTTLHGGIICMTVPASHVWIPPVDWDEAGTDEPEEEE